MRLLDRILADGFETLAGVGVDEAFLAEALREAQLIVADNVADYYFAHQQSAPNASDFPNVMLPFKFSFIEMRFPSSCQIRSHWDEGGVLLEMWDPTLFRQHVSSRTLEEAVAVLEQPGVAYHLEAYCFLRYRGIAKIRVIGSTRVPINCDGQIISNDERNRVPMNSNIPTPIAFVAGDTEDKLDELKKFSLYLIEQLLMPSLLALSFMHCRNVKMVEEVPPPKLSKKHEKKTGKPLLRYHILKIDHMKAVLEREGKVSTEGLKKALHICRGHFATYGKDGKKLLFGKHAGRFWIPMHMRGNPEHGIVDKTYDVH